ncbi:MAG TPA: 4Fe-4S dicluster domain-containing protein [Anaerolineae bacterium]|nr:4Fe-4S dicluster domain-containing protein [Anaerolineae bacterium]
MSQQSIVPEEGFLERVSALSHQNISACYFCLRCSAGCPSAFAMDFSPAQVLRFVQLGHKDALLRSSAIWLCIGCETCGSRCPNQIHAGAVMDALRQICIADRVPPGEPKVFRLHQSFLDSIKWWGRLHELSMLVEYKLLSRDLIADLDMGAKMFLVGKIHPLPKRIRGVKEVERLYSKQGAR